MTSILLVEDDEADVLFLRRAFRKIAWEPPLQVAPTGEDALQYLQREGPYADGARFPEPTHLILDVKVPRVNGLEVLGWLRRAPAREPVPSIILTSSEEPEDIARAYALGCDAYIVKPVTFVNLVR